MNGTIKCKCRHIYAQILKVDYNHRHRTSPYFQSLFTETHVARSINHPFPAFLAPDLVVFEKLIFQHGTRLRKNMVPSHLVF